MFNLVNGSRYEGEFLKNKITGKGHYYSANGDLLDEDFMKGAMIDDSFNFVEIDACDILLFLAM